MQDTKAIAESLVAQYKTRNPFEIAEQMGILVLDVPLTDVLGFTQKVQRQSIIYLADNLENHQRNFICAHELGHICMHDHMNCVFLSRSTQLVTGRYETEAQHFAVDLLFDDYDLQDYLNYPISTVANILGVDDDLAEYRMKSVNPRLIPSW